MSDDGGDNKSRYRLAELERLLGVPVNFGSATSYDERHLPPRSLSLRSARWDCFSVRDTVAEIESYLLSRDDREYDAVSPALAVLLAVCNCVAYEIRVDVWEMLTVCLRHNGIVSK